MDTSKPTGAESVTWNYSILYSGIDDPALREDIDEWCRLAKAFRDEHKGNLAETLGKALADLATLKEISEKIQVYLGMRSSVDTSDAKVQAASADTDNRMASAHGDYLSFFDVELCALDDATIAALAASDAVVARHLPFIEHERENRPHLLTAEVEGALTKRMPFGRSSWTQFCDEYEAALRGIFRGEEKTMTELLHIVSESMDAEERAEALKAVDGMLSGHFARYSAQTLWMVAGAQSVEDRERKRAHPMAKRNRENRVDDAVVAALHRAALDVAAPLAKRYYRLKAAHLGLQTLRWSDRNAPMPFSDNSVLTWDEAVKLVLDSRERFSPKLAQRTRSMIEAGWIDAAPQKNKRGGAFNISTRLRDGTVFTGTFMSYLGALGDAMTLSHELGHGEHALYSGEAQGTLMMDSPMAFCEIFSHFGETMTFNLRKEQLIASGDTKALLAIVMSKLDDMMNSVVRQICFSEFERVLHGWNPETNLWEPPRKRSAEELSAIWMELTERFYGKSGDVFTYENTSLLWAYVHHFHSPFYVYAYALDELLAQALNARLAQLGPAFEEPYLDMMRTAGTKDILGLTAPMNFDLSRPAFWAETMQSGMGGLLAEAETLSKGMGVSI